MRLGLIVALVLGSAAACSSNTAHVDGPIDLEPVGGFAGTGDGSPGLHIEADGAATREHANGSRETATLDGATLADLGNKIEDARFDTLAPLYNGPIVDDNGDSVSVVVEGTSHTVVVNRSASPPAALKTVIDTLVDIRDRPIWH
jgi:hypothetical protein